jgi:hypothetical protein
VIAGPFSPFPTVGGANPHGSSRTKCTQLSPRTPCRPKSAHVDTRQTRMDTRLGRKDSNPQSRDQTGQAYVCNVTNRAVEPPSESLRSAGARRLPTTGTRAAFLPSLVTRAAGRMAIATRRRRRHRDRRRVEWYPSRCLAVGVSRRADRVARHRLPSAQPAPRSAAATSRLPGWMPRAMRCACCCPPARRHRQPHRRPRRRIGGIEVSSASLVLVLGYAGLQSRWRRSFLRPLSQQPRCFITDVRFKRCSLLGMILPFTCEADEDTELLGISRPGLGKNPPDRSGASVGLEIATDERPGDVDEDVGIAPGCGHGAPNESARGNLVLNSTRAPVATFSYQCVSKRSKTPPPSLKRLDVIFAQSAGSPPYSPARRSASRRVRPVPAPMIDVPRSPIWASLASFRARSRPATALDAGRPTASAAPAPRRRPAAPLGHHRPTVPVPGAPATVAASAPAQAAKLRGPPSVRASAHALAAARSGTRFL